MSIELNKVGIEIDGKVYQFYKLSIGFQRRLIEVQKSLNKLRAELAKKYDLDLEQVAKSEKVSNEDKLKLAEASLAMSDALSSLFVNKEEAAILDNFDSDNMGELINALK